MECPSEKSSSTRCNIAASFAREADTYQHRTVTEPAHADSSVTCDHVVHGAHLEQHLLDEAHLGAGLQVADALAQDGGEHAPDLRLAGDIAVLQQLRHAADALRVLDDEVHLQIELAAHQLYGEMG